MKRRDTGSLGEKIASDFLKKRGFRILETNYRCPHGEIDIIAKHKDFIVFIEVRSKTSLRFGTPEESITANKKEHMIASADYYRQTHDNIPPLWRIDMVAVELSPQGKPLRIELVENAVDEWE